MRIYNAWPLSFTPSRRRVLASVMTLAVMDVLRPNRLPMWAKRTMETQRCGTRPEGSEPACYREAT